MPESYLSDFPSDEGPAALPPTPPASENSPFAGGGGGEWCVLYFTISSYILHIFSFCLGGLEVSRSKLNSTFADWIKSEHRLSEKPVLENGRPHTVKVIQNQNLLSIITSWLRRGRETAEKLDKLMSYGSGVETVGSLGPWLGSPVCKSSLFFFESIQRQTQMLPWGGRLVCHPIPQLCLLHPMATACLFV